MKKQPNCAARKTNARCDDPSLLEPFLQELRQGTEKGTFDKQSKLLLQNLHHPSLHAKKYDEARGLWQARVNISWRFYFKIVGDVYFLEEISNHPK
jgi:hypothetical protein